jgi:hypothetical protein
MDWLKESWGYLVLGGGLLATAIVAVRAVYGAERDRKALQVAHLEREKLELEVARLRNSPDVVKERRAIYDKLRQVVHEIMREASVDMVQLAALHELRHDSEYRYPPEIVTAIGKLIVSAVTLHWSDKQIRRGPEQMGANNWEMTVKSNSTALLDIVAFNESNVDRFRPYLKL